MSVDREALRAWLLLLKTSSAIKKSIDTELRAYYGLSISRFDVLSALDRAESDGLRAGELSQRLMVTEGNITQMTAALVKDGLIRRTASPQDGRVAIFQLTKEGARLFVEMADKHSRWIGIAFSNLTKAELAEFQKLLKKVNLTIERTDVGKDAA